MGGWKLEVFRMALYISFPVVMFHVFHQPEIFADYFIKQRRDLFPPEDPEKYKLVQAFAQEINGKRDAKRLAELEALFQ